MTHAILKSEETTSNSLFDRRPFFFYSVFAFLVLLVSGGCLFLSGKTLLSTGDGFLQHYANLVWLKETMGAFFRGEGFAFWSWPLGLGMDTIGVLPDVLTDPFAYIAAAFPKDLIDVGYTFSEFLRFYCAGAAMFAFLKYEKMNGARCVMGGLGYAFCTWAMTAAQHAIFLNPLILFPLVMLGIHRIDREKKPGVFILSIAASLITNIYFAYITGLMAAVYCVVRYFFLPQKHTASDFFKRLGKYAVYGLVALLLSAPVVVSSVYVLLQAPKNSATTVDLFRSLQGSFVYFSSLVNGAEIEGNYAIATISGVILAFYPLIILDWKQKKNRCAALFFAASLFMLGFPIFGSIFNGMSYSAGRWCYMLAFFALWSLLNGFTGENLKGEGNIRFLLKWDLILALFLGFFLLMGKMLTAIDAEAMYFGFFNLAFLLVTMSLLLFWYFAKQPGALGRTAVLLLVCSILCSNVMVLFPTFANPVYHFTDRGAASANYKKSVQRATSELPKEDFYRTDQVEYVRPDRENVITQSIPANEVMYYGNGTVAGYSSYFDSRWFELHKNLNCNNGYFKRVAVYNNDNRSRMDFLMGVRYFLGDNQASKKKTAQYAGYAFEPEQERQGVKVLKSRFETGLGYGVPAVMKKRDWLSYNPLDREQILMQAVIVPDDYTGSVPEIDPKTLQLDTEELPYEIVKEDNLQVKDGKIHVEKKHGRLTLKVGEYENSELYCSAQNLKRRGDPYGDYGKKKSSKRPGVMKRLGAELTQPESKNPGSFTLTLEKDKVKKFQGNFLGSNQGFTDIDNYLTNLGYSEKGSGEVTLTFGDAGEYTFDELKFYTVSQKNFDAQAKALSEQRLAVEKNENNFISGSVHMKTDGILRMSIIHSPGWKAKVDGKPQEIFETMDCGSGIFLPAGTHQIELSYTPILWIPSLVACGIGLAALVLFALLPKKKKKNL